MEVLQIAPRLPPSISGVGDYAYLLARQLRLGYDVHTRFLVCDPAWRGDDELDGFKVERLEVRGQRELKKRLSTPGTPTTVLLHYVGYGYEKSGCPTWLIKALSAWCAARNAEKKRQDVRQLVTMFHELYASGPPWTKSFWYSPLQKSLAAKLARISSRVLTNRDAYAEVLRRLSGKSLEKIFVLPVFSNIGEPDTPPPLTERRRRLAVFGGRGSRLRVFHDSVDALKRTCRALRIEEILDIGDPVEHTVSRVDGVAVRRTGTLPASEISDLLSDSIVGFFNYPTDYLSKSTIFAAYCANRLLPIGDYENGRQADGLRGEEHYWLADRSEREWDLTAAQSVADNAYSWYQGHSLIRQAAAFASCIAKSERFAAAGTATMNFT